MAVTRVGLLGCGTVGGALVDLVSQRAVAIENSVGIRLEVRHIAVRNLEADRGPAVNPDWLSTDSNAVATADDVDIVIELLGGIEPARELVLGALNAGKPVITGNKELVANHGAELFAAAAKNKVDFLFEAAVAGAIPILRPLRESLLGEDVTRIMGIVNGTTNFILTRMTEDGASYDEALTEAQELGYAEADPTADVEGFDAGAKAAIMASIAFGVEVVANDVHHEGISNIDQTDIAFANRLGYRIKLLAIAEVFGSGANKEVGVRVHPVMVPLTHPLASVRGSFNAIFVEGAAAGELMFYGRGAGGDPTSSAVLGDLVDAAVNLRGNTFLPVPAGAPAVIRSIDEVDSAYYLNMEVGDAPGVLAEVAGVFGHNGVSIGSMEQTGLGDDARLVFITHIAKERALQQTLIELGELGSVRAIRSVLRVVED